MGYPPIVGQLRIFSTLRSFLLFSSLQTTLSSPNEPTNDRHIQHVGGGERGAGQCGAVSQPRPHTPKVFTDLALDLQLRTLQPERSSIIAMLLPPKMSSMLYKWHKKPLNLVSGPTSPVTFAPTLLTELRNFSPRKCPH